MGSADLANLSDKLMLTTVVLYIIALVSYAADLGFSRRGAASRATAAGQAEKEATVLVGAAGAWVATAISTRLYPAFPIAPPLWALASAMAVALAVGAGFGAWPARRAARLDPIAALSRR